MTARPHRPAYRRARAPGIASVSSRARIVCLFTIAAMLLGGGGSSAPISELLLQLAAAVAIIAWALAQAGDERHPVPRAALWLAALAVVLPLIQLVPLPPGLWQALPDRGSEAAALALAGRESAWMPWSQAPARTFASLLSLVPPVAALLMTATLARHERAWVIRTIAAVAVLSVVLGALQLSSGGASIWRFYGTANVGFISGFQANRNAEADVLLIGLVAATAAAHLLRPQLGEPLARVAVYGFGLVLLIGTVLTGSRTGILLAPVAILFALTIWRPTMLRARTAPLAIVAVLAAMVGGLFAARWNPALGRVLARFTLDEDFRFELWKDTIPAISRHWPFGSGLGTFRQAFLPSERLAVVDATWPVRAHNDFLEILLEGGVFGGILVLVVAGLLVRMMVRAWSRRSTGEGAQVLFAIAVLVIIGLHSVVDYPLRSMALAHLSAVAAGMLAAIAAQGAQLARAEWSES